LKKILLYFDFNFQSGFGHLSRTEAFFDAISFREYEIFISCELDCSVLRGHFNFLQYVTWIDLQVAKRMSFEIAYIDTYSTQIFLDFKSIFAKKKIALIDNNFEQEIPKWVDLIIALENKQITKSNEISNCISGLTLIKNKIKESKLQRQNFYNFIPNNISAVINFGGSELCKTYLLDLQKTIHTNKQIDYLMYCAPKLIPFFSVEFSTLTNLQIREIDKTYYQELAKRDMLITSAGTSFLEALYMNIPIVLFNLFDTAKYNFKRFRFDENVLFSGEKEEVATKWQSEVLNLLNQKEGKFSRKSVHKFLDSNDISESISKLLL
jgi:spore coat polysaccharide biosynthesis predicted glycosyltransferase SpsG